MGLNDNLNNANIENLSSLCSEQSILEERRLLELRELCGSFLSELDISPEECDIYELLSLISERELLFYDSPHGEALAENRSALESFSKQMSSLDKAMLCRMLISCLDDIGRRVGEADFFGDEPPEETFVYVKNSLADEAYEIFSAELADPRVYYCNSFKEAAELVASGRAGYCLLPLEERGGRLRTVDQLIFSGDLKISGVSPVFGFDGLADMKYAMISGYLTPPIYAQGDDRYLEIRVPQDSDLSIGELIFSAESFGHSIYRIATVSLNTDDGERGFYSVVIRGGAADFTHLLTYLTLFSEEFIPVGIYKNLE